MLKDKWVDRKNGVDINSADDINQVAHAVVDLERKIEDGVLSAEVHVGASAPVNDELLWVDTGEEDEEENEEAPAVAPPDFAANEGEDGYIKNRTHYVDKKGVIHKLPNKFIDADWMATSEEGGAGKTVFIPEQTVRDISIVTGNTIQEALVEGDVYAVEVNGVLYRCECYSYDGLLCLGNGTLIGGTVSNNEPFCVTWAGGTATRFMFHNDSTLEAPIGIKVSDWQDTVYNKLPKEFLPDISWNKLTDKPLVEGAGELLLSHTATFATDAAAKSGQKVTGAELSLVGGAEYWLDVNGNVFKCHVEESGSSTIPLYKMYDAENNLWMRQMSGNTMVYGQAAGTFTYNLYALSESLVLDPQYIPPNVARKSDIPKTSGGGVDVTAEVGQTIIVVEVDENGKPTKWESADYQPRTHWRERASVVPSAEGMYDEGAFVVECGDFEFEVFKEYIITINGTEYITVAQGDVDGNVWVGNPILMGGEDDGTPFALMTMDGILIIALLDGQTSLTISVDIWKYTKIPSEYVNSGAFYIDVNNREAAGVTTITTTTTYNEVENAWRAGIPMIVRINDGYAICAHVSGEPYANGALKFLGYTDNFVQVRVTLEADGTADDYKTAPLIVNLTIMD